MKETPAIKPVRDLSISLPAVVSEFAGAGRAAPGFARSICCCGPLPGPGMTGPGFIKSMAMRSPWIMVRFSRAGVERVGVERVGSAGRCFMPAGAPDPVAGAIAGPVAGPTAAPFGRGARDAGMSAAGLFFIGTGSLSVIVGASRRGGRGVILSAGLLAATGSPVMMVGPRRCGRGAILSAGLLLTTGSPGTSVGRWRRETGGLELIGRSRLLCTGAFNPNWVSQTSIACPLRPHGVGLRLISPARPQIVETPAIVDRSHG